MPRGLTELIESAYRGDVSRQGWTTEADLLDGQRTDLDSVRAALSRDDVRLLIATSSDEASDRAGRVLPDRAPPTRSGVLRLLRRGPDRQNLGMGKTLLAAAERTASRLWQAGVMEMTVYRAAG